MDHISRPLSDAVPRAARRLGSAFLEALSPTRCACCERPGALICDACLEALPLIDPVHACIHCAAPFGDILCTECRDAPLLVGRCLATATFEGPAARIVRAYKDAGERRLAPFIAQMLWDTALHAERAAPERYAGILTLAQAIVFVPATERAFVRRGFDHMERVAAELAGLSGVSVIDALLKHGAADQRLLGRHARAERAREAYEVVESVRGLRLVLVDDVITTGATVRAAAAALERAGAARVDVLALARVW